MNELNLDNFVSQDSQIICSEYKAMESEQVEALEESYEVQILSKVNCEDDSNKNGAV